MSTLQEFYPTPKELLEKIFLGMDWRLVETMLEPSAGKGDIADFARKHDVKDIDCIEPEPELRKCLEGKEFRVVGDDFLTFHTFKKYDLIAMNPPFSEGAKHLRKALEIQKNGGAVICILNAQTIKNPYTRERMELLDILEKYHADISYMQDAFVESEHSTSVEIAVVKVMISQTEETSYIMEGLRQSKAAFKEQEEFTDLASADYIQAAVDSFNLAAEAGVRLIQESRALTPYLWPDSNKHYTKPTLEIKPDNINKFLKDLRGRYWSLLFNNERFTKGMTSELLRKYHEMVHSLSDYDFSYFNIKQLQIKMNQEKIRGVEEAIMECFDLFTQHHWFPESCNNVHYYNGWSTNKAYIVQQKVIIPLKTFDEIWKKFSYSYNVDIRLADIESCFKYLAGCPDADFGLYGILRKAEEKQLTKNIETKYMKLTFYKKGTCHIVFKDLELLKKFNIFAGRNRGWLPYSYGKKAYEDLDSREKEVIDSFEGEKSYREIFARAEDFLINIPGMLMLESQDCCNNHL